MTDPYSQRNELAVAFAKMAILAGFNAGRGFDDDKSKQWDDAWRHVVYCDLPDGRQVSWHMSPECVHLLNDLPAYTGKWNGTFVARQFGWSQSI